MKRRSFLQSLALGVTAVLSGLGINKVNAFADKVEAVANGPDEGLLDRLNNMEVPEGAEFVGILKVGEEEFPFSGYGFKFSLGQHLIDCGPDEMSDEKPGAFYVPATGHTLMASACYRSFTPVGMSFDLTHVTPHPGPTYRQKLLSALCSLNTMDSAKKTAIYVRAPTCGISHVHGMSNVLLLHLGHKPALVSLGRLVLHGPALYGFADNGYDNPKPFKRIKWPDGQTSIQHDF